MAIKSLKLLNKYLEGVLEKKFTDEKTYVEKIKEERRKE